MGARGGGGGSQTMSNPGGEGQARGRARAPSWQVEGFGWWVGSAKEACWGGKENEEA